MTADVVSETRFVVHAITPGDHFSARTGSAVPTVVHGLASGARAAGTARTAVLVARGTYGDRYESADVFEYDQGVISHASRYQDAVLGLLGGPVVANGRR